ncbi:MAG: ABC transporter permease subunit [Clostridia bacterium]|nr:ABC transporter permease subunit [Clostridia bacterium]
MAKKKREARVTVKGKSTLKRDIFRDKQLYLMLVPFFLWYILFYFYPMHGILAAFQDYDIRAGIFGSEWVGFKHFINFFKGADFWKLIRNSLMINVWSILLVFPASIILALLLNEISNKKFKTAVSTIAYLPYFVSTVVVAGIVTTFLSPDAGIINVVLEKLGFEKTYFLVKAEYFRPIYTIMSAWQGVGFGTIIYTSALSAIDAELYEAASIDGASRWKQFLHITFPSILPTIAIMLVIRMGSMMGVGAEAIILLQNGGNTATSDVISSYVYRRSFVSANGHKQFSFTTAVDIFNGVIALILVWLSNTVSKKMADTSIW